MLRSSKELQVYRIHATGGEIGHLEDFYFDDREWDINYFVVDIGTWLHGKKVLMSPHAVTGVHEATKTIYTPFTIEQIRRSADVRSHRPVALQQPHDYYLYLGWPHYVGLSAINDSTRGSVSKISDRKRHEDSGRSIERSYDEHLRSSKVVSHYHIIAVDGEIGHFEDFIVDDQTWAIRYAIAVTGNWWSGKKVLLPAEWVLWISWEESNVYVGLRRERIATAPAFEPGQRLTHELELEIYNHYKHSRYSNQRRAVG